MIISLESVAVAAEQQVSALLGEDTVILHLQDGIYFGLDQVGTSIWALLQQPRTVRELRDRVLEEFEVDAGRCEDDLIALLGDLVNRRLVEIS